MSRYDKMMARIVAWDCILIDGGITPCHVAMSKPTVQYVTAGVISNSSEINSSERATMFLGAHCPDF